MGCDPCYGRHSALRLFLWNVLAFPTRAALGHATSWLHLFGEHFMEYQWRVAQLHSQSLFPLTSAQPTLQHHGVDYDRLQPGLL